MHIEPVGIKNASDIFCGKECSFAINSSGKVFAWGLNNWGQLGIGNRFSTSFPTEIMDLSGKNITMVAGGEHHSIACDADGKVWAWGKNDEGQMGLGDLYGEFCKEEKIQKEEAAKA